MENNSNKQNDKVLDVLIARTNTRETSTLTIVTVVASASLILLGLYSQGSLEPEWIIWGLGISFPILGLIYRTITYCTIQKDDYDEIKKIIPDEYHKIIDNKNGRKRRTILHHSIICLPILGWIFVGTGILKIMNG